MPIVTRPIQVPDTDPPLSITIRKLSYFQVKQAKDARLQEIIGQARNFADIAKLRESFGAVDDEAVKASAEAAAADPAQQYDMQKTLHFGIIGWSYSDEPKPQIIDDLLGPAEADFIFHEIVAFTERSADEKKGSATSSGALSELAGAGQSN